MKKKSLFKKFTLLVLLATSLIAVVTHTALHLYFNNLRNKPPILNSFHRIASLAISQIHNKDTAKVRDFLNDYGFDIRYVQRDFEWSSSPDVPLLDEALKKGTPSYWSGKRVVSIVQRGDTTYIFRGRSPFVHLEFPLKIFILWLIMLAAIFGVVHYLLYQWLRPVRILQNGVRQISEGRLDISLPKTTSDELGDLVEMFNTMVLRINNDMKSRDQLIRDISHEFRSPLARMLLALEFIPEGKIHQTFRRNIAVLEKMTSSILEDERLDSPFGKIRLMPVEVTSLLMEIVESKKEGPVSVVFSGNGPCEVDADAERLRMALSNILDNAVNYSSREGVENTVSIVCNKEEASVVITVNDNGIGIPEADLPFIFEPFFRVDKARKHSSGGYGLGLHLTKRIIEAHKGTITVTSRPGNGTTVSLRLPIMNEDRR